MEVAVAVRLADEVDTVRGCPLTGNRRDAESTTMACLMLRILSLRFEEEERVNREGKRCRDWVPRLFDLVEPYREVFLTLSERIRGEKGARYIHELKNTVFSIEAQSHDSLD